MMSTVFKGPGITFQTLSRDRNEHPPVIFVSSFPSLFSPCVLMGICVTGYSQQRALVQYLTLLLFITILGN